MHKGHSPVVALAPDGMIGGVALGADATAEHEWGIDDLLKWYCSRFVSREDLRDSYRTTGLKPVVNLRAERTLDKNLDSLFGVEGNGTFTITTVNNEHTTDIRGRVVLSGSPQQREELTKQYRGQIVTEWDGRNFRVTNALVGDEKLIKKLKVFFEQMKKGSVAFFSVNCGIFPKTGGKLASGLVLVDLTRLSYAQSNHWKVMDKERIDWLELQRRSRIPELSLDCFGETSWNHTDIGYLWPMWKDLSVKEDIVYGLNPSYGINADYFGPYTEGQLRRWLREKQSYRLRRSSAEDYVAESYQPAAFSKWLDVLQREIRDLRIVMGTSPHLKDGVWFADICRESATHRSLTVQYSSSQDPPFGVSRFNADSLQTKPELTFHNADASIHPIKRLFESTSL